MISVSALEEAVLALLCHSREFSPILALKLTPNIFTSRTNKLIAQTALNFIQQYKAPPQGQLEYLLENDLRRGDGGKLLGQTLEILLAQSSVIDPKFVLDELDKFLSIQRLSANLQESMEALAAGDLEKAQELIYKSSAGASFPDSPGIWFSDAKRMVATANEDEVNGYFPIGVSVLDRMGIRLARKTISVLIAPSGKGKSWWLIGVGKANLQHHNSVLHITTEISEELTARRYLQAVFGLTKDKTEQIRIPTFERDSTGKTASIQFEEFSRDSVIAKSIDIQRKLAAWKSAPPLLIKEFPTGSLSSEQLDLYLDSLDREKNFRPDVIIIDMPDLMRIDAQALRIDTGRLYRDLRGIAVRRNAAMAAATQGNRESSGAKFVDVKNVAEDWSKIGTSDNIFTYSQTAEEKKVGLARFMSAKARDATDRVVALISQSYAIGQFCLDSVFFSGEIAAEVTKINQEEESK